MLAAILALVLAGCGGDTSPTVTQDRPTTAYPEWLIRVYPPPAGSAVPVDAIQVEYRPDFVRDGEQGIRLLIDGTDVTTYSEMTPGRLVFDPNAAPVRVGVGTHTAEVRHVQLPGFGEQHTVLDTYEWTFDFL